MASSNDRSMNRSGIVMCKCGDKARFAIAKSDNNWGRPYYGYPNYNQDDACGFFRWVVGEEDLYAEISALADARELLKLRRQLREKEEVMEDDKCDARLLKDENKILKRIALAEGLEEHGLILDGELIFKRKDAMVGELHRAQASVKGLKLLLVASWAGFALYLANARV